MSDPKLVERLEQMDHAALVALAAELLQTYVVDGLGTNAQSTGEASLRRGADQAGEETFAGMLRRLKADRPGDPVLEKFIVNGEHIQVRTPMGNVDVTEYRRAAAPVPPSVSPPPPSVPTSPQSIYNRELYGQPAASAARAAQTRPNPPAPAPTAPASTPSPSAPAAPTAAPAPAPASKPGEQKPAGDRVRMIELD